MDRILYYYSAEMEMERCPCLVGSKRSWNHMELSLLEEDLSYAEARLPISQLSTNLQECRFFRKGFYFITVPAK